MNGREFALEEEEDADVEAGDSAAAAAAAAAATAAADVFARAASRGFKSSCLLLATFSAALLPLDSLWRGGAGGCGGGCVMSRDRSWLCICQQINIGEQNAVEKAAAAAVASWKA